MLLGPWVTSNTQSEPKNPSCLYVNGGVHVGVLIWVHLRAFIATQAVWGCEWVCCRVWRYLCGCVFVPVYL